MANPLYSSSKAGITGLLPHPPGNYGGSGDSNSSPNTGGVSALTTVLSPHPQSW